jgi:hypothetical protein
LRKIRTVESSDGFISPAPCLTTTGIGLLPDVNSPALIISASLSAQYTSNGEGFAESSGIDGTIVKDDAFSIARPIWLSTEAEGKGLEHDVPATVKTLAKQNKSQLHFSINEPALIVQ